MKHTFKYFACLFVAILCFGQVWADTPAAEGTTLFSEDFSSYSANNVPSGSVTTATGRVVYGGGNVTYTCADNGSNKTMIYAANLASGTSPELLIGKSAGVFTIAGIPSGGAKVIAVSFKQNAQKQTVSLSGTGYSTTYASPKPSAAGTVSFDISVADGADATFTLIMSAGSSNVRVDDILLTVKTAGEGAETPTCATPTFSPAAGSYEGTQNVTISSTAGATIYYTTDGSDPKTSGTKQTYSSAIPVAADMTIKAYATLTSYDDSEVATAAYTITEGPDVTLDLIDGNWGFPTSNTTEDGTYTNSVSGYSVTCHAPTNYKVSGSDYFFIGKSGAYILLPEFTSPIEKIVVSGNSGGAADVAWNIYQGETAVSTAASGCKNDAYTFDIAPANQKANVAHSIKVTNAKNLQIKVIKIYFGETAAVDAPTISGDENFVSSTTVTITQADANHIYYTTNGNDPTTGSTEYTAPFTVNADGVTTVKAIAVKGSDVSAVASKTFTKVTPKTTAAELRAFATSSNQNAFIQLDGWKVTFVNGNNAYLVDPSNEGVVLNNASHGYTAGDELNNEVVEATIKLNSGRVQLTGFTSTNITATAGTVSPAEITDYSTLTSAHQSRLVTLKNATYASSAGTFSDGTNVIYYYDQFSANPTLVDGTTYDVTGIVIYYKNNTNDKIQIAPRTAADVVAQSEVVIPTAANLAALKAATRGSYILTLTNAVVTYVNGNNAFIEEGSTGALIYFASHGYSVGDCLNGDYQVTTTDYQGKFEITAMEAQAGAATTTAEIPLTTVSIATLNANFASYESRRVKIAGANVTDAISGSDRNGAINDGAALAVYAAVASTITLTADNNVDIIGYPGFHNTDQQLNVWRQEDITVNSTPTPEGDDYTMSFDMTRASYDDAADEEVVWNSNVVTITAQKSSGTKVTNYLAGNYSGTTLIAETRLYENNTLTFTPKTGITITKVEWKATAKAYAESLAKEGTTTAWTNATAAIDGTDNTKVIITPTSAEAFSAVLGKSGNNKGARVLSVVVYYQAESEKSKLSASIAIANINTAVGEDDILLSDIEATSNPNKKAISYAVTSGNSYVSITGEGSTAAFHALAEGTATITATIPDDLGNYTGATTTFNIVVGAAAATLESIAISGTATKLTYEAGAEFNPAGLAVTGTYSDQSTAPITEGITWAFTPATLSAGTTSVSVTATVGEITSAAFVVDGLTVNAEDCDGSDDFATTDKTVSPTGYATRTTTDGWVGTNVRFQEIDEKMYWKINGKTTAVGTITSPVLSDGIATLKFRYANTDSESKGVKVKIEIKQGEDVVKEYTLEKANSDVTQNTVYTETIEDINVTGDFQIIFTNLSPSSSTSNKDRVGIGRICWTSYSGSVDPDPDPEYTYTNVRTGLEAGRHYTACLKKKIVAVKGATIWSLRYRNEAGTAAYLEEAQLPLAKGTPFIYQATASTFDVAYEGDEEATKPVASGALRGTFDGLSSSQLETLNESNIVYLMYNNSLRPLGTNNHLDAYRAYLLYDAMSVPSETPQDAPGRRVRSMPMQGNVATGVEAAETSAQAVKVMIDGQLFIQRGDKLYDVTGQMVK